MTPPSSAASRRMRSASNDGVPSSHEQRSDHRRRYDPGWPGRFAALGQRLRFELGTVALRIDHIGSTAVPGLAAKPVIDVQISVAALEPMDRYRAALERAGFVWRADNVELTKRYFREASGPRTHLHARRAGSFGEQLALLFRDYLRTHPDAVAEYAALKERLAQQFRTRRQAYVDAKGPLIWELTRRADAWAQHTGWEPGTSDA